MYLYVRMLVLMGISFYASRLLLEVLGIKDYGLYNVVGGIVILLSFLNNTLITSCQRFLSYEIGLNNGKIKECFTICFILICLVSILIVLICESLGIWYVNNILNVSPIDLNVANIIFQCSIFSVFFSTLRTPFMALILSQEKMGIFSLVSILEGLGKLIILLVLKYDGLNYNRAVISYSYLMLLLAFVIAVCFVVCADLRLGNLISCQRKIRWASFRSILKFASWNTLGIISDIGIPQGINMLFNKFCGLIYNAAIGITNQIDAAVYGLSSNFQMAFRPQIVKLYASHQIEELNALILLSSKVSFVLMAYISIPVIILTEPLLNIWLGIYPEQAIRFSQIVILASLLDSITAPIWMTIQATGKIKWFQIFTLSETIVFLVIGVLILSNKGSAITILWCRVCLSFVFYLTRIGCLKHLYDFPIRRFILNSLLNGCIFFVSIVGIYMICTVLNVLDSVVFVTSITILILTSSIYFIILSKTERNKVINVILRKNEIKRN